MYCDPEVVIYVYMCICIYCVYCVIRASIDITYLLKGKRENITQQIYVCVSFDPGIAIYIYISSVSFVPQKYVYFLAAREHIYIYIYNLNIYKNYISIVTRYSVNSLLVHNKGRVSYSLCTLAWLMSQHSDFHILCNLTWGHSSKGERTTAIMLAISNTQCDRSSEALLSMIYP